MHHDEGSRTRVFVSYMHEQAVLQRLSHVSLGTSLPHSLFWPGRIETNKYPEQRHEEFWTRR